MYKVFFISLLLLLQGFKLNAKVSDHLKPIVNKTDGHAIRNVDFIYVINLDKRPEKFDECFQQLQKYGITPFRFSAVNGWELSFDTINDVGVKYSKKMKKNLWGTCYLPELEGKPHHEVMHVIGRNYFCHCMSRGAIGIVLSHLSVLQDAYNSGYEAIWVMEDDIEVIQNPHLISEVMDRLDSLVGKDGWDVLFTDQDTKNRNGDYVPCFSCAKRPNFTPKNQGRFAVRSRVGTKFRRIGARYGAYSMIVRRSGMEKLLNFFKKYQVFLPYDMDYTMPNDINMFTVIDDIVSTKPTALSDNAAPNYEDKTIQYQRSLNCHAYD